MNLLIISHTPHYRIDSGVVGWGPTVREIDHLSHLFEEVIHLAPMYSQQAPPSALPYQADNVRLRAVPPSGGDQLRKKIGILKIYPLYLRAILSEMKRANVVHIRCPANISLLAIVLLAFLRHPRYRWVKYAGNWQPQSREPRSYTFQRCWLRQGFHRGVVTVNGRWPEQPRHVAVFYNPSLTAKEIKIGRVEGQRKRITNPVQLIFVGALNESKGVGRSLQIARKLRETGVNFEFHLIGDGPDRAGFEYWAHQQRLQDMIAFHGWIPKPNLSLFYAKAHIMLFPSASEGWPKVLSEAMAFGVVPVAGAVSSIPQILAETGAGVALPLHDVDAFVNAILDYINHPDRWKAASRAGVKAAGQFTYQAYLQAVKEMFRDMWDIDLIASPFSKGKSQPSHESAAI